MWTIFYIQYKKIQCLLYKISISIKVLILKCTLTYNFDLGLLFHSKKTLYVLQKTYKWANVYPRYEHCGWSILKDFGVDCTCVDRWSLQHLDDWLKSIGHVKEMWRGDLVSTGTAVGITVHWRSSWSRTCWELQQLVGLVLGLSLS